MIINTIGLGLIGGSICKALKKYSPHTVLGWDISENVLQSALEQKAIDATGDDLAKADLTIVSLYPDGAIEFMLKNALRFKKGSVVMDVCGVKKPVVEQVTAILAAQGVSFVGAHPMAGSEFSGFQHSDPDLFLKGSMIFTPTEATSPKAMRLAEDTARQMGFPKTVTTTPEEHDRIIAYTSQLAHVVSNAYIKSPSLPEEFGFSAGSFRDLTRVAYLNEQMWTSLFLMNREPLLYELDTLISNLGQYREAIDRKDAETLKALLKDGRIRKEKSMSKIPDAD